MPNSKNLPLKKLTGLTLKEEKFCQEYTINGGNASDAYRAAFNAKNMKNKTIHEKASRIFRKSKVRARIEELKKPAAEKYEITREFLSSKLMKVVNESEELIGAKVMRDRSCLVKATVELSKLHGLSAERMPVGINVNLPADMLAEKGRSKVDELLAKVLGRLDPKK